MKSNVINPTMGKIHLLITGILHLKPLTRRVLCHGSELHSLNYHTNRKFTITQKPVKFTFNEEGRYLLLFTVCKH